MRLDRYLEEREDNISDFADALDSFVTASKEYTEAVGAESEKATEKQERATEIAYHERRDRATHLVKCLEKIAGIRRYVVEEE